MNVDQQRRSIKFITGDSALLEGFSFARRGFLRGMAVLLTGESGSGKRTMARELVAAVDSTDLMEIVPSEAGEVSWEQIPDSGSVYFSQAERLTESQQWKLLGLIESTLPAAGPGASMGPESIAEPVSITRNDAGISSSSRPLRIIVGCDADLSLRIRDGGFLRRLYFVLSRCEVTIPALRQRRADIPLLTQYFLDLFAEREDTRAPRLDPGFFKPLERYLFPGNVRELEHLLEKALLLCDWSRLTEKVARKTLQHHQITPWAPHLIDSEDPMNRVLWPPILPSIGRAREQLLEEALSRFDGNQSRAARALGITPAAVNKYVNRQE